MHLFSRLFIALVICCCVRSAHAAANPHPNVVFILADDLGWSDLHCYGGDLVQTPNIDRLAQEGVRFTDFYTASPVCSPTRASILTGQHPARLHMTTWYEATLERHDRSRLLPPQAVGNLPSNTDTIASLLHNQGYVTALIGKWHLGDASHYPEAFGFDVNIGGTQWGATETYFYPYRGSNTWGDGFRYIPHLEFGSAGEYLTDRLTDEAIKFIDRAGEKPFFLYLAHHAPHTPIQAKTNSATEFQTRIDGNTKLHHRNARYAAMIKSLDESVGRVVKEITDRGLAQNTLIIFTSDNGGYVNNWKKQQVADNFPLRSGKGSLYEGGIRVPLIVRWPGVTPKSGVCHVPVTSTDFCGTISEIAGLPPTTADGISILPLFKKTNAAVPRDALYFHFPHYYATSSPVSAVRVGDWKLIEYYEDGRVELYNLKDDLSEKKNLTGLMPKKVKELQARLHAWLAQTHAQLPTENPNCRDLKLK